MLGDSFSGSKNAFRIPFHHKKAPDGKAWCGTKRAQNTIHATPNIFTVLSALVLRQRAAFGTIENVAMVSWIRRALRGR